MALTGAVAAVAGCGAAGGNQTEATEALDFYEQMTAAGAQRLAGLARFTAADGVLDARATAGRWVQGRDEQQRVLTLWFGQDTAEVSLERLYVDADQALVLYRQPAGSGAGDAWWMALDTVGGDGLEHREVLMSCVGDGEVPVSGTSEQAEQLAAAQRALWAGADTDAVGSVYATDAAVRDTLLGTAVAGADAIAAAVTSSPTVWRPMTLGPDALPAVFLHQTSPYAGDLTRVVAVVVTGADVSMAIDMTVDEAGLVSQERRFHPAEALPTPREGTDDWWSGLQPPPLPADQPPVGLPSEHGVVQVYGADEPTRDRIAWALSRFDAAGLREPLLGSVVVDTYGPDCDGASGVARLSGERAAITVCPNASSLCDDGDCTHPNTYSSQSILHELAHAWVADNVDDPTRHRFMAVAGVTTWDDRESAWAPRGEEVAAEALSWGLMDTCVVLHRLGDPNPSAVAAWYRTLTGGEPIVACRPERMSH